MEPAFGLVWPGKEDALRQADAPARSTVVPTAGGTLGLATSHVLVEGDNLEVFRVLQRAYAGTVDLVAIDPPYNTGRRFVYDDDWSEATPSWLERTGQRDAHGHRTTGSPQLSGRHHSRWLSMMAPRLVAAHRLLADTGFLVVCIGSDEVHHLRMLLDEVFGEDQFVADIVWQKAYTANMTARWLSTTHDHLLVYARDASAAEVGRVPRSESQLAKFTNPDGDPRGPWKAENLSASRPYSKGRFEITTPAGRRVTPPAGRCWRCSEPQYRDWVQDGRIWFGADGTGRPMLKRYLSEIDEGLTPSTWWSSQECGSNKEASTRLKDLFEGRVVFDTPKPVRLLRRVVDLFCPDDGLVVDLFAGAGTTGHAVLEANDEDGGSRRALLVQLPTPCEPDGTLAEVCRARVQRAWARLGGQGEALRSFVLAPPAEPSWDPTPPPDADALLRKLEALGTSPSRTEEEAATELLCRLGVPLATPVVRRDDGGWWTEDGSAAAFLTAPSSEALIAAAPRRAAVPDTAWPDAGRRLAAVHALRRQGTEILFHRIVTEATTPVP